MKKIHNIYNEKGQTHSQTEWHSSVLWRGLAELAEKYLENGSTIHLEGKTVPAATKTSRA